MAQRNFKKSTGVRNPGKGARSYRGVVEAKPGTWLLGGKRQVKSARFSTKSDAKNWLYAMQQPGAGRLYIEVINRPPEIGPGPNYSVINPGSQKALATAYAAKGGRVISQEAREGGLRLGQRNRQRNPKYEHIRGAYLVSPDGTRRKVKNLGWLLRNWKSVTKFSVYPWKGTGSMIDSLLVAHLRDGGHYQTDYASNEVLRRFLNRPVFEGVPIDWSPWI